MIVKIIYPAKTARGKFGAVSYNTGKIERNKGELMKISNFGSLQGLSKLRPQDYINYLEMVSSRNKSIREPQFHAVISAKERSFDKQTLTLIAERWLNEMGYGSQPYLIVFHKDTGNNHVHMVTSRVGRDGKKIDSAFEKRRALLNLNKVLGYNFAFEYKFSTRSQFLMILEQHGYPGTDPSEQKIAKKIAEYAVDKSRAAQIKALLQQLKDAPDFLKRLKDNYHVDLVFHAAEGKKPYGYTIIDNEQKKVFKGSEVWALKELLNNQAFKVQVSREQFTERDEYFSPAYIQSVWIADDVDDQQIHGMRRRRQKKARTNTR